MNTKGTTYGSVIKRHAGWQVNAWNPFVQKSVYVGFYKDIQEATNSLNNWNYNFYSNNTWLLPRGISIRRANKTYMFTVIIRNKTVVIGAYKTLDDAVKAKIDFITKLI